MKTLNAKIVRKIIFLLSSGFKMTSVDVWGDGDDLNINISQLRESAEGGNAIFLKNDFNDSSEFSDIFQ